MSNKNIYNLKNDVIFSAFFSRKGNEAFLKDFLNALLGFEITKIKISEEVNLEKLGVGEKGGRLDLKAELNDGVIVNVEMQRRNKGNMEIRTSIYSAKTLSREIRRGTDYKDVQKVIMINILDYTMFKEYPEYISKTAIVLDKHREYKVMDNMEWWFIELPKFRKARPDMNEKINQWLAFWDDKNKGWIKMAEDKNDTLKKARKEMNYLTGDAEIRRLAELREKWDLEYNMDMDYARAEGEKKGKQEEKIETAKKLLDLDIDILTISKATGLSKDEIEKINNNR